MNLRELKEIFRLVEKTDFSEVEIVQGDWRVRIERGKIVQPITAAAPTVAKPIASEVSDKTEMSVTKKESSEKSSQTKYEYVTSPFVGTFYRSPSPDSNPYVKVGDSIRKGQVLCIVEAMKLMNEIESDFDGKIIEIYSETGQAVEFGEKLFSIEPTS